VAYAPKQAQAIINHIQTKDPVAARVLTLMLASGLRITEACWLRAQDIDLEERVISLNVNSNHNRIKGGRPREVVIQIDNHINWPWGNGWIGMQDLEGCSGEKPSLPEGFAAV
jgi:site-specific recombinase XerC